MTGVVDYPEFKKSLPVWDLVITIEGSEYASVAPTGEVLQMLHDIGEGWGGDALGLARLLFGFPPAMRLSVTDAAAALGLYRTYYQWFIQQVYTQTAQHFAAVYDVDLIH